MISIIMPVYNGEKYLSRAIDSVIAQTNLEWELLVADDGSTDSSLTVARRYAGQDHRIHLLELRHTGVSHARNRALEQAQGEFITFLDCDDYMHPQNLETLLNTIANCDVAVQGYYLESELTHEMLQIAKENPYIDFSFMHISPAHNKYAGAEQMQCGLLNLLESDTLYPVWNKLYRKEIILRHNIQFDQTIQVWGEDELFNFQYLRFCDSMACTSYRGVYYTTQEEQALNYRYDDVRWITERRLHLALTKLFNSKKEMPPHIRRVVAETYIGKLVLLLENITFIDFADSNYEYKEAWEAILSDQGVQEALEEAGLKQQFVQYLCIRLNRTLLIPAMLSQQKLNGGRITKNSYLFDWLIAAGCAAEEDERFLRFHDRAMQAGAPWSITHFVIEEEGGR